MNLRVSVSDIDSWRYYMASEDMELEQVIARLLRKEPSTEAQMAGKALHKALELSTADGRPVSRLDQDGYSFDLRDIDGEIDLPPMREVKLEKPYLIDGVEVTLVGVVDAIHGTRIDDHKTTSRYDAERFFQGYQWRFYLDMFDANQFRWNVFVMSEDRKEPRRYWVREFHQPTQWRYPRLQADCIAELSRYVDFALNYLPAKEAA